MTQRFKTRPIFFQLKVCQRHNLLISENMYIKMFDPNNSPTEKSNKTKDKNKETKDLKKIRKIKRKR